jgi:hypothetical protein
VFTNNIKKLQLKYELAPEAVAARAEQYVDDSDYDRTLLIEDYDVDVFRPNGLWLLSHRIGALDWEHYKHLVPIVAGLQGDVDGRGSAIFKGAKIPHLCKDGSASGSSIHHIPKLESLGDGFSIRFGYSGRTGTNPYGHKTGHWEKHPEVFKAISPFVRAMCAAYRRAAPEWFYRQQMLAQQTPEWLLPDTCCNNLQINQNLQFALHLDKGNFDPAVLAVLTEGDYSGAVLVFLQYLLGVRLKPGNILVADTRHGWHGNTPLYGVPGESYRHSYVAHFHRAMLKLGSKAEEEERRQRWIEQRNRIK